VLHGGIISTVLDEIMIKAADQKGLRCVTAELTVKFKKPAFIDTQYVLIGSVKEVKKKLALTEGVVLGPDNEIIASAAGKMFIL